ncbi:unnamed protein product [Boreogadus saida]
MASLQAEDGHDQCPACLGVEYLREAVSDNPCMNCSFMPHALRLARLAEVEGRPGLPPSGLGPSGTRRRASAAGGPPGSPLRVYQPRPLRLRNPLIQRMTGGLQLRPVASLQRRKSKPLASQAFSQGSLGGSARGFGCRSHPCRRCVDGPSVLFQWSQARRLGQLLFRPWSEVYRTHC